VRARRCAFVAAALAWPVAARGHGFAPGYLALREGGDGRVEALWKEPVGGEGGEGEAARVRLPARCREVARRGDVAAPSALLRRFALDCGAAGIGGAVIALDAPHGPGTDVLVVVRYASGRSFSGVLRGDAPTLTVPDVAAGSRLAVARGYLALGVRHIATGADHLAFVLGLLLLSRGVGGVVRTVTAFTAGHSVTLALASLGLARASQAPVEATIAASIALLGVELLDEGRGGETLTRRAPWTVAGGFGLLHGFGFAGALAEAGLPTGEVPLALLCFNAGVELGQLAFVAAAGGALWAMARVSAEGARRARRTLAYAIGAAGVCWTLQRVAAMAG
jgi:hydrogenase/urease accessory protein HupE